MNCVLEVLEIYQLCYLLASLVSILHTSHLMVLKLTLLILSPISFSFCHVKCQMIHMSDIALLIITTKA